MGKFKSFIDRISTRLVGLLVLPILAMSVFSSLFAFDLRSEADTLSSVSEDAELLARLSGLRTQIAIERTVTSGVLAISDVETEMGLDLANDEGLAGSIIGGLDMQTSMTQTRGLVDTLAADLPSECLAESFCQQAKDDIVHLAQVRRQVGVGATAASAVIGYNDVVESVDLWIGGVEERLNRNTLSLGETRMLLDTIDQLQTLNTLAEQELRVFVPILTSRVAPNILQLDQLVGRSAITGQVTLDIDRQLPDPLREQWTNFLETSAAGDDARNRIISGLRANEPGEPIDIETLIVIGGDLSHLVDRLQALAEFQRLTGDQLIAQAAFAEAEANDNMKRVLILGASLLLLTLALALIVARHLARSMRQLGHAAELLQTGEFDTDNLPTKGPREVVDTARAFTAMTETLKAVDAHATAIATGQECSVALLPVPGHLGESLRNSLQRVENMAERLRHEANHDALTGLTNRAGACDELETLLSKGSSDTLITTMFIDLDRFKRINDTFGHHIGDALLTAAGFRLQQSAGGDRTLARLGGDEFLLVASDLKTPEEAVELANRIATDLDDQFSIDGRILRISASIGISQDRINGQTVADILRSADLAAYEAKRNRTAQVVFSDDALLAAAVENLKLEENLRGSWTRGEMELYLQPLVHPGNGRPASAEALMRWTLPDGTQVSPGIFIPVAEESGMIVAIDQWMINEVARQISAWQRIGHPAGRLRIAINVSGQHFTDGDLVTTVRNACTEHGISPAQLVVEVTESCAVADIARTVEVLEELHEMGIKISLDDFGTGYSSLSYLQQLPIDTVKIDRTFVQGLPVVDANAKIVELVATLSAVLELAVVAEGVETIEQADCLEAMGIQYLQGFYFARPMPATAFGLWVEKLIDDPFSTASLPLAS